MGFRFVPRGLFRAANRYVRRWHASEHAMDNYSPPSKKEDRYGDGNTIHHTNTVDVEIGPTGEVCAVWFRCRMIPFTSNRVIDSRASSMQETPPDSLPGIKAIVFE